MTPGVNFGANPRRSPWTAKVLLVLFAATLFWCTRAPWLRQPLVGEEGLYATIYSDLPAGPGYGLMVRYQGVGKWAGLSHPALMYEWMRGMGVLARRAGLPAPKDEEHRILWARTLNAGSTCVAWMVLATAVAVDWASVLVFACLMTLPMAVGASLYMQTDTTCGWFLCGLVSLAFAKGKAPWILGTAVLLALVGKQEWLVGLGLALGLSLAWGILASLRGSRIKVGVGLAVGVLLAAALGSWGSWTFDPANWDGGLSLMLHLGGGQNVLAHPEKVGLWLRNIGDRGIFFFPLFAGLGLQTWMALRAGWTRTSLVRRLGLTFSWGLAVPFLLSIWGSEFRYLAPAMSAVTVSLALELPDLIKGAERRRLLGLGLLAFGLSFGLTCRAGWHGRSLTEQPGIRTQDMMLQQASKVATAASLGCVPFVKIGYAWMEQLPTFAGESLGPDGAKSCLQIFPGAHLCP